MTESEIDKRYHRVKAKLPDGTEYEALIGKTPEDGAIFAPYIPESMKKVKNANHQTTNAAPQESRNHS